MSRLLFKLPYSILIRGYYLFYQTKKKLDSSYIFKKTGIKNIEFSRLKDKKSSDTLFVIGSGASLNMISPEKWRIIEKHNSIGFNFSFLHTHIPTYYMCEAMAPIEPNTEGRSKVAEHFFQLSKDKKDIYKSVVKLLADLEPQRLDHAMNYLAPFIDDQFYRIKTINGFCKTEAELKKNLLYLKRRKVFSENENLKQVYKYRASLSMAISLGINLGYKNIILCGIDLNDPRYFYQDAKLYPHLPFFRSSADTKVHATLIKSDLSVPIDKVVYFMNELVCKEKNINLYVEHSGSALAQFLPVYHYNN